MTDEFMTDKITIAGKLIIKGWHRKACEVLDTGGVCNCIHCQSNNLLQKIKVTNMEQERKQINLPPELEGKKFRIRKLTPRECFRLMGVDDADIDKIQAYPYQSLIEHPAYSKEERMSGMTEQEKRRLMKDSISNSSQYKLAGNSIVVDVLYHLFRKMFIETDTERQDNGNQQLSLF